MDLDQILASAGSFEKDAHKILATQEAALKSRVITVDETYRSLDSLSLRQDDLFRQSLRCAEEGLFRAAHVMAWAACMDFLLQLIDENGIATLKKIRPKWQGKTVREIAENVPERQLVEVLKDLNICTKVTMTSLVGLLNRRNECAHPTDYFPGINETLGYLSEIIKRVKSLQ